MMRVSRNSVINVSAVPNPSPFRYPGGKSWLIPYVRKWLKGLPATRHFVEAFAGGANVGLTVAIEGLARHVTLIELDREVATVWDTVLNGHADALAKRIMRFKMTKKAVKALLAQNHRSLLTQAFCT